jgi:DNA-binding CsgD family transcriptional regulator
MTATLASPLRIALRLEDARLDRRLRAALAAVPGLALTDEASAELVLTAAPGGGPDAALSPREREVLALMAEGASNRAIAARLGISVHTAKFHVRSVTDKLDATGRTDAVAQAARTGVIHL